MIESVENALQITVVLACAGVAFFRANAEQDRKWYLLCFFYGCWLLGDIYWLVCLIFFGDTPHIPMVSDLAWYGSYVFLYLLLNSAAPPERTFGKHVLPWLVFPFTAGMAVFYMQWGQIASNLICATLMGLLMFSSIRRLQNSRRYMTQQFLCAAILVFCMLEYVLWTSSCFFNGGEEEIQNPYIWIDFLLTVSIFLFLPATRKAAAE